MPFAGASKHLDVSEKEILMSSRNIYDAVDGVQSQARVLADKEAADLELLERRLSVRDLATQFESGQAAAAAKLLEDEVCVFPEPNLSLPNCTPHPNTFLNHVFPDRIHCLEAAPRVLSSLLEALLHC